MTPTEVEVTNTTIETNDEKIYDKIIKRLEPLSTIKFAAYRVACKLRILQKYLKCKSIIPKKKSRIFR